MYLSTNKGVQWVPVNNGLKITSVYALAVSGSNIFAGTNSGGIFLSTNNGTNWTIVTDGLTTSNTVECFAISETDIYAGTNGVGVWRRTLSELTESV